MKHLILILLVIIPLILLPISLNAQTDTLTLRAPAPQASFTISATALHPGGNSSFFYWVVAKYPIGNVISITPKFINNLPPISTINTVSVSWSVFPTAPIYDLLRTTTNFPPTTTCNCLIAASVAGGNFVDNVASPTTYTFSAGNANPIISNTKLDNADFSFARILTDLTWQFPQICFNDLTCQSTAATGSGLLPTGVIPGTYGDANNVGQFTVNNLGLLTAAANIPIASVGLGFIPANSATVATVGTGQIRLDGGSVPVTTNFATPATITKIAGADNATFFTFIDFNGGSPVEKCLINGGNIVNYTVVNFNGATCAIGVNYPQDSVPIARFTIAAGVFTTFIDDRSAGWGVYLAGNFFTRSGRTFSLDTTTLTNPAATKLMTAGTIAAGAGNSLCTDINSNATTTGCTAAGTMILDLEPSLLTCSGLVPPGATTGRWNSDGAGLTNGVDAFCNASGINGSVKFQNTGTRTFYYNFSYPTNVTNIDVTGIAYTMDGVPLGNVKFSSALGCSTAGGSSVPIFNTVSSVTTSVSITGLTIANSITNLDRTGAVAGKPCIIELFRDNTVGTNNPSSAFAVVANIQITRTLP